MTSPNVSNNLRMSYFLAFYGPWKMFNYLTPWSLVRASLIKSFSTIFQSCLHPVQILLNYIPILSPSCPNPSQLFSNPVPILSQSPGTCILDKILPNYIPILSSSCPNPFSNLSGPNPVLILSKSYLYLVLFLI